MKITLESTDRIITAEVDGKEFPARVWQGTTERGIRIVALIPRIAAESHQYLKQLDEELREIPSPAGREAIEAFPLRMIL